MTGETVVNPGKEAPFDGMALSHIKYKKRYQDLFLYLTDKGIKRERLLKIFSSEKAAMIDRAAIVLVSDSTPRIGRKKSQTELKAIAKRIVSHLYRHKKHYIRLEQLYGVNREIVAAILYKETDLGQFGDWRHDAFTALNSVLGFADLPVAGDQRGNKRMARIIDSSRQSLAALLLYGARNDIDILAIDVPSSYAGAIGMPQFLPIYLDYAVSADNTRPDLDITADAILSVGNLMRHRFQWPGLMALDRLYAIDRIAAEYIRYDRQTDDASFCMAKDLDGYPLNRFVDVFPQLPGINYAARFCQVLMNYNFSSNYVLDVMQIAFHAHSLMQ